jgi:hypothetical protein
MNGHALMFGALWIATTSLCICEPNESKAVEFDYAEGLEAPGNSAVDLSRQVRVTVYVFDGSAQFRPGDLITAEMLAAKIFEKVGIQVMWVADASAANLLLRVWKSSIVQGTRVTSDALGFRLSMNEAVVLSDATRKIAANWKVDPVLCLGLTIAHEMGHLLLQSETHSVSGVMKARWLRGDLAAAERGGLTFTPQEGHFMRNGLRRLGTQVSQER